MLSISSQILRNKSLKNSVLVAISALALVQGQMGFASPDSLAQQTSNDFSVVAKKSIPAVVSIKVISSSKSASRSAQNEQDEDELQELFKDEFFHRFFTVPKNDKFKKSEPSVGQASGFIVSPEGYVMTNSHVVRDASEIVVTLNDGREFVGKTVGQDPNTDIAIVKIDAKDLPYLQLGDSDKQEIAQWVMAIGNPFGLQASVTVGVISAKGRNNLDLTNVEDFIQTDAAINRGNSGGPLINLDGQVIGMNTAIVTNTDMGYMGIGFSIPSNILKQAMDQIIKNGSVSRGYIGVLLQTIDKDLAQAFNVPHNGGALIATVSKDSPAEKAGLKQGDIIQSYNEHPVTTISALRNAISLMTPGSIVKMKVLRNAKPVEINVTIANYPDKNTQKDIKSANKFGFEVQNMSSEADEYGVMISKVNPGTPASLAGLKKGAIILAVNQKKIENMDDFNAALAAMGSDKPLLLLVKQGNLIRFISLRIE